MQRLFSKGVRVANRSPRSRCIPKFSFHATAHLSSRASATPVQEASFPVFNDVRRGEGEFNVLTPFSTPSCHSLFVILVWA